ncbi:fimbrial protein [Burkholderia ubonensis]|uniref:fimbrial protein n=1 Tax=Burkholderia ubonensis TaxID=101571 RepID=UPI0009B34221
MRLPILLALISTSISHSAWAACTSNTTDGLNYFIASVSGFAPPPFDPTSIPIGGVIYRASGTPTFINASGQASVKCDQSFANHIGGVGTPSANNIYPTSVPNIGMRLFSSNRILPFASGSATNVTWDKNYVLTIELVKTGNITAAGVLSGSYAQYRVNSANGQLLVDYRFSQPVLIQPKVPTCKVATPLITVPMGTVHTHSFQGVGTTTPPRMFSISLTCSGGSAGTSTNAHVTLTDATTPGNTSTTLSMSKDSTASGIGVQILKGDALLRFGPDSAAVGNTNQWHAGTIAQGQAGLTIPLSARYVQTGAKVSAGSANARATFTLSYQ